MGSAKIQGDVVFKIKGFRENRKAVSKGAAFVFLYPPNVEENQTAYYYYSVMQTTSRPSEEKR